MKSIELTIKGMTCQHCVMSLREELDKIEKLDILDVQIGVARIKYEPEQVSDEQLHVAVSEAGFVLESLKS